MIQLPLLITTANVDAKDHAWMHQGHHLQPATSTAILAAESAGRWTGQKLSTHPRVAIDVTQSLYYQPRFDQ